MTTHGSSDQTRRITDARALAAMTHPVRQQILELLDLNGPATVSTLAEGTGEAVGNVSHHLKVLASAELVTPAPELAKDRRERWWQAAARRLTWDSQDFKGDPASEAIADAAQSLNLQRQVDIIRAWHAASEAERDAWDSTPFSISVSVKVTLAELAALYAELMTVLDRYRELEHADDGVDRKWVFIAANGVPRRTP